MSLCYAFSDFCRWIGVDCPHDYLEFKMQEGISVDSRTLKSGQVFFALSGPNFDGHKYVANAEAKGALAVVVQNDYMGEERASCPVLKVADPLAALVKSAKAIRKQFKGQVIAITGSAGKSSTKNMVAVFLGKEALMSPASFNNLLGLAQTLWLVEKDTRYLILEMGMNAKGEIAELCHTFSPTLGMITNIGDAHVGKLGGFEGVYAAKKELFDYLGNHYCEGIAICFDDKIILKAASDANLSMKPWVKYSEHDPSANVYVERISVDESSGYLDVFIWVKREMLSFHLPFFGRHHAINIASAVSMALLANVSIEKIKERASDLRPAKRRGDVYKLSGGKILIDESYNSNPSALKSSLHSLKDFTPSKRRVLVLADMAELEQLSEKLHLEVLEFWMNEIQSHSKNFVWIGVGNLMAKTVEKLKNMGHVAIGFTDAENALSWLKLNLKAEDIVLVKGSRSMGLDRVVDGLF